MKAGLTHPLSGKWSTLCGHGQDFEAWSGKDFGHCFEQIVILAPSHALLAIISVYHFGRRRTSIRGRSFYVNWTWFLILRFVCVLVLIACPVFQVICSVTFEKTFPSIADDVVSALAFFSWTLHALYVWSLRYIHDNRLRGPASAVLAFLIVTVSSAVHIHTVIVRHISHSAARSISEEYASYVNLFFCIIYLVTLVPDKRRIYHTNYALPVNINQSEDEAEPLTWDWIRTYHAVSARAEENTVAEKHVGCLSWLTFHWVQRLMSRGAQLKINSVSDLYILPERLRTDKVEKMFKNIMQKMQETSDSKGFHRPEHEIQDGEHTAVSESDMPTVNVLHPGISEQSEQYTHTSGDTRRQSGPSFTSLSKKVGLFKILNFVFGWEYYSLGILKLMADGFGFAGPVLLNYLVTFIEEKSYDVYKGYLFAGGLFLSTFLGTICSTQFDYNTQVVAYKMRCALITAIYKKSLSVSGVAQSKFTTGEIVNFMSTDTDRILNFCPSFHAFWSLPFQIAVSLYLLYQQVGLAFLAGVAFAIVLIPINRFLAVKIGKLSSEMMKYKDDRVKVKKSYNYSLYQLMSELLYGIRVVKFYSWESHFTARVNELRRLELHSLKGRKYLDALCVFFWATTPVLISILTFVTFVLMGHELTAAKVFTSLSLFMMLISPLNAFPWVINGLVEAWVSLTRIQEFVCLQDSDLKAYYSVIDGPESNCVIQIKKANFTWMRSDAQNQKERDGVVNPVHRDESAGVTEEMSSDDASSIASMSQTQTQDLQDISLKVYKGQLFSVIGKVGSGKSSLLSAIIGEMDRKAGEVTVEELEEGFALVSQEAWVQHATVRDNILFGKKFERQKYDKVIEACALVEDLKLMPAGDMTEIGENGITLSGGQRARVALARAVYQDKAVYLLDDPLSAVDAHVAQHIFTHCIMGLLSKATRILCTHHTKFLRQADWVVTMEDGRITQSGPPEKIIPYVQLPDEGRRDHKQTGQETNLIKEEETKEDTLVQEEERERGAVSVDVYKAYWQAVGSCLAPLVLISLFLMQASRNVSDWWLSYWVSHIRDNITTTNDTSTDFMNHIYIPMNDTLKLSVLDLIWSTHNDTSDDNDLKFYLGIYGGLAGANSLFTLIRAFLFAYGGICAATLVHERLLASILKASVAFFDMTPIGRILNRFSSDLYTVDDSLPFILNIFLAQGFGILGTLVITCYGLPWFTVCLIPLGAVYYKIQHYYRFTSRELKRLSSVTLSPIYSHFSETITGLATIRAMRHSERFCKENVHRLDVNQRAQYATQLSARWLDLRLRFLGVAMVSMLSFIAVIQHQISGVSAGLVGLALSYSLSVTNLLGGVVMFFTETEKELVSMERCQHYITSTPSEKWEGALFPPSQWPSEGVLEFDDVRLQYRQATTYALDGVSFKSLPGEKIGIVGRTGAGKSSMFLALFRMTEMTSGRILVDDVNIANLDLADIRSRFAIIPQDPFLFSGTIRRNLDPTGVQADNELWSVLDRCHLKIPVERMGGLGAKLTARGREFSVGQRQLVCLARAMLTKAKILCIDEATASVDLETDGLIQNTIRHEFRDSTVLTIAHRINTVLDSHRVLVMKEGMVIEFAPPDILLQDSNSLFYHMVYGNI